MRVEIAEELESDDARLEIPWASAAGKTVRFIDLKKFPEKIGSLQECCAYPPLLYLLRKINASGSPFLTAKCDAWTTTRLSDDERQDFNRPCKVGGYVDLLFARAKLNSRLPVQLELGKQIEAELHPCRVQGQVEIAVRRCLFHPQQRWGYYLTLFIHGYGMTRSEAKKEWGRAVVCLGEVLPRIGAAFVPGLRK